MLAGVISAAVAWRDRVRCATGTTSRGGAGGAACDRVRLATGAAGLATLGGGPPLALSTLGSGTSTLGAGAATLGGRKPLPAALALVAASHAVTDIIKPEASHPLLAAFHARFAALPQLKDYFAGKLHALPLNNRMAGVGATFSVLPVRVEEDQCHDVEQVDLQCAAIDLVAFTRTPPSL